MQVRVCYLRGKITRTIAHVIDIYLRILAPDIPTAGVSSSTCLN